MALKLTIPSWYRRAGHGSLADNFSGRNNSIGLIRLVLALSVVVSHANPVGFGTGDPGAANQGVSVGAMAVTGFFVLSGFLITRSAMRLNLGRYLWARALRILPGLWLCLLITAFVVAPLLAMHQHGGVLPHGFWRAAGDSPFRYVRVNMWTGLLQFDVSGVLSHALATGTAHNPAFDGALWTLAYEATCYLVVGGLAVTAVLRRAPRLVLAIAVLLWFCMLQDLWHAHTLYAVQNLHASYLTIPFFGHHIGSLSTSYLIYLGLPFALGAVFQLYIKKLPINDVLGIAGFAVFFLSLFFGGYFAFGVPALAYALMWFSVRSPLVLRKVGRKRDLSYGIYIYGFVVEQVLVVLGVAAKGYWTYLSAAIAGTVLISLLSWYAIEKPALLLKDWTPRFRKRDSAPAEDQGQDQESALPPHAEVAASTS